jgi:hypothetical protein
MYLRSGKIISSEEKEDIRLFITEKTALKKRHYNTRQSIKCPLEQSNINIIKKTLVSSNINTKLRKVQYNQPNGFIV